MLFQFPIFSIDCKFALCAAVKLCGCDSTHSHSLRYVTTFMGPFFRQFLEFHQPVFFSLLFYIAFFNLGFSVVERGPICWILYCWRYFVSLEFSLLDNYRGFSSHGPSLWNCFLSFFFSFPPASYTNSVSTNLLHSHPIFSTRVLRHLFPDFGFYFDPLISIFPVTAGVMYRKLRNAVKKNITSALSSSIPL